MAHNSAVRPAGSKIRHVVIHTNQGPNPVNEVLDSRAENLAKYLNRTDINPVSYHILTDDDSDVVYLPDDMISYSTRAANPISLNLCFLGYAEWSRGEWLEHWGMLERGAARARMWCKLYNIPVVKLTPRDVFNKHWGIIGHGDWTYAEKMRDPNAKDSHTDPGEYFPWDVFLNMIEGQLDDEEEERMRIDNYDLRDTGSRVLLYPIGHMGADNIEAWVSASTLGMTGKGFVRVFAQGDKGGMQEWLWDEWVLAQMPDNLARRPGIYLKDGVTKLLLDWDLRSSKHGGVFCVEYRKRSQPTA